MDYKIREMICKEIHDFCCEHRRVNGYNGCCVGCKFDKDTDAFCHHYNADSCSDEILVAWYKSLYGNEEKKEKVDHPSHYQGKHECIDEMRALFGDEAVKAFCRCNIWKYTYRADLKNGVEDLKKAEWYMDYLMKMEKMTNNKSLLG